MIRCSCGAELFSIESICSACLPPKPPRALFVEDLRIKLANREEELLDWKETVELVNTENVELRAERDRLKAALEPFAKLETYRGAHDPAEGTMRMRVVTVPEIEAARKALEDDKPIRAAGDGR